MTKLLARLMGKTPEPSPAPAANRRETFANAVATLRQATGKAESRTVPCRCAKTGLAFSLRFERLSPAHRFQIARIDKEDSNDSPVKAGFSLLGRQPAQHSYDAREFHWAELLCPHCGDRSGLVYCNKCGETVCGGRVQLLPGGGRAFACHDRCGATGELQPATHVQGGAGNGSGMAQGKLAGPAATPSLPGSAYPRMQGPKTR
jgi:hypothetical protein